MFLIIGILELRLPHERYEFSPLGVVRCSLCLFFPCSSSTFDLWGGARRRWDSWYRPRHELSHYNSVYAESVIWPSIITPPAGVLINSFQGRRVASGKTLLNVCHRPPPPLQMKATSQWHQFNGLHSKSVVRVGYWLSDFASGTYSYRHVGVNNDFELTS